MGARLEHQIIEGDRSSVRQDQGAEVEPIEATRLLTEGRFGLILRGEPSRACRSVYCGRFQGLGGVHDPNTILHKAWCREANLE